MPFLSAARAQHLVPQIDPTNLWSMPRVFSRDLNRTSIVSSALKESPTQRCDRINPEYEKTASQLGKKQKLASMKLNLISSVVISILLSFKRDRRILLRKKLKDIIKTNCVKQIPRLNIQYNIWILKTKPSMVINNLSLRRWCFKRTYIKEYTSEWRHSVLSLWVDLNFWHPKRLLLLRILVCLRGLRLSPTHCSH